MLNELQRILGRYWGALSRWMVQWVWEWRWVIWYTRNWGLVRRGIQINYYSYGEWRQFFGQAPLIAWRDPKMLAQWMKNRYNATWKNGYKGWGWYKPQ